MAKPYPKEAQLRKPEESEREPKIKVSAAHIAQALLIYFRRYNKTHCYMALEVGLLGGRRVDAVLLRYYNDPTAFEIKVSRADWLREIREPDKHLPALDFAGQLYVAAPPGTVEEHELPDGVGLYEVRAFTNKVKLKVRADRNAPSPITWKEAAMLSAGVLRAVEQGIT